MMLSDQFVVNSDCGSS